MTDNALASLIGAHLDRYPKMEVLDIYKLLYQATLGVGHPISNKKVEREWLEHEFEVNAPNAAEMLLENISPDDSLRRLHVRPYIAAGGKLDLLLEALIRSAEAVKGKLEVLAERWTQFETLVQQERRLSDHFALRDVQLLGKVQREAGWSAVQHSPVYVRTYQPAYRVLTTGEAVRLCEQQKITGRI